MFKLQMRTMDLFLLLGLILTGAPRAADGQESVTVKVREGHEAILPCNVSTNMESEIFAWKNKDKKEVFFYDKNGRTGNESGAQLKDFNDRAFHFKDQLKNGNASIRITNTKMADSGAYSCCFRFQKECCHVELEVESVTVKVREGQEVILQCSVSTKDPDYFEWKKEDKYEVFFYQKGEPFGNDHFGQHKDFKGRVFHLEEELKDGNISIRITNTKMADSGAYICYSPQQFRRYHVELVVACHLKDRTAEIKDACPKPYFSSTVINNQYLLQCKVSGVSPLLQLKIKNSSGTDLHAERTEKRLDDGTMDIILQTKVTKYDDYTCVATQDGICHQISSKTSLCPLGPAAEPTKDSTTSNETVALRVICGLLGVVVVLLAVALLRKHICKGPSKDSRDHAADESAPMSP